MKKILLGLGTLTVIVAPVATVVSCGGVKHTEPPVTPPAGGPTTGGPANIDSTTTDNAIKAMTGIGHSNAEQSTPTFFNIHKFSAFKMNGEEVISAILNTKLNGQLEISDSDICKWSTIGTKMDTAKSNLYFKNTLATDDKTPAKVIDFKKADLVKDSALLEKTNAEISKDLDSTKKYIYKVEEVKADSNQNDGEWKISFFEAKAASPKLAAAIDTFKNQFEFDKDGAIKGMGGMYLYGQHHIFSEKISNHDFTSDFGGVKSDGFFNGGDKYHDRAAKDNMVDWNGLKPKKGSDIAAIKKSLDGIEADSTFVFDAKTLRPKVRLNVLDTDTHQLETIYIDSGDAFNLEGTPTEKDFANVWAKNLKFSVIFNKINKLKSSASELLDQHVPGVGLKMFDLVSLVNTLARTNDFNQTSDFINKFYTWLKSESDINIDSIVTGLMNFNYEELDDALSIGCKGWTGFNDVYILSQKLNEFLEAEFSNNKTWKLEKVTTVAQFNQKLIDDAMKPQRIKDAKKFLDNHNPAISYKDPKNPSNEISGDDILALASSTKDNDYKAAVALLSSKVAKLKLQLDATSDAKRTVSGKDAWSQKSVLLGDFIDNNSAAIFGNTWKNPGFTFAGPSGKWSHNFKEACDDKILLGWMPRHNMVGDYSVSSYINQLIKSTLSNEDFDKLKVVVLTPLGLL